MGQKLLLSLTSGVIAGALFRLIGLPVPAPNTLAGVLGIVGLFLGYFFVERLKGH
ncbi:MAG: DUF1427 family protein [Elusimicrobia bacterium]|nr:DUF1427 family protein [Elusimicrobiota bacterium]